MPEVFYGFNRLMICNSDKDFLLEFSPIEALRLAAFKNQKEHLKEKGGTKEDLDEEFKKKLQLDPELNLNLIDMVPKLIEAKEA